MKRAARLFWSASFFLCGTASFAALPWIQKAQLERFRRAEPHYQCPVPAFSNRAMIRNDVFGKGRFGALRGSRGQRLHKGVDLLVRVGNPVTSSKTGRVSVAGLEKGYGWYVELRHPDGRLTRYAHLSKVLVSRGEWVLAGQKIGQAGKSGNAHAPKIHPHLHFEIREGEKALDPVRLMDPAILVR